MSLSEGIIYYVFTLVFTLIFILCGCFLGITLRKRKNLKSDSSDSGNTSVNIDEIAQD